MARLALPDPTGSIPEPFLTRKQHRYLVTAVALAGLLNSDELCERARCDESSVRKWRKDARFVQAEHAALTRAVADSALEALATHRRLLRADLDHGGKGLAEAGRMARWTLERLGIVDNGTYTGRVAQGASNIAISLTVADASKTATRVSLDANDVRTLDADWHATPAPERVHAAREGSGTGYLPEPISDSEG